jgi:hypothetical protein
MHDFHLGIRPWHFDPVLAKIVSAIFRQSSQEGLYHGLELNALAELT